MPDEIKRPNYFTSQLLQEGDFQAEQLYHRDMRYLHNRGLHSWGIAYGFDVTGTGRQVSISPGMAIDREGRELVLAESRTYDLTTTEPNTPVFITLAFRDVTDEEDIYTGGGVGNQHTRITERPEVAESPTPSQDGSVIILARVSLNNGTITTVTADSSVRRLSGAQIPPEAIATEQIKDGAVTTGKLASPREFITGTVDDNQFVAAPDGNPDNWVIFVSPRTLHVRATGAFVSNFTVDVFAEARAGGWTIHCSTGTATNPNRSNVAHYLLLKK